MELVSPLNILKRRDLITSSESNPMNLCGKWPFKRVFISKLKAYLSVKIKYPKITHKNSILW